MTNDERHTAHHEAGHAVIARVLGLSCGGASIISEEGHSRGHSVIDDPRFSWQRGDGPKRQAADAFCVALYAGYESEFACIDDFENGDHVDRERATGCLAWAGVRGARFVGDDIWDRHERRLREKAGRLVKDHRLTIERVAAALIERRTLDAGEIDVLMTAGDR